MPGAGAPGLPALLARVPDDERTAVQHHIDVASRTDERREFEHRVALADGTERWVHAIVQRTQEQGRLVLRGTVRDDTQRHKGAVRLALEHEIARLLVSDSEPELVMGRAIEAVCTHLRWDCGAFWGVHADGMARCAAAWVGGDDPMLGQFVRITRTLHYRPDEGSLGRAIILAVKLHRFIGWAGIAHLGDTPSEAHLGETLPFLLWRFDSRAGPNFYAIKLGKAPSQYFKDNFVVTTSGSSPSSGVVDGFVST